MMPASGGMPGPYGQPGMGQSMGSGYPQQNYAALAAATQEGASSLWIWIVLAIVVVGGGVGVFFALT